MNIRERIFQVLTTDQELNSLIGTEVYFHYLPENYGNGNAIVYTISQPERVKALGGKVLFTNYLVSISCAAVDMESSFDITDSICNAIDKEFSGSEVDISEPAYDPAHNLYVIDVSFNLES